MSSPFCPFCACPSATHSETRILSAGAGAAGGRVLSAGAFWHHKNNARTSAFQVWWLSSQRSIWIVYPSGCVGGGGCRRRAVQPAEYLDRVPFRVRRRWQLSAASSPASGVFGLCTLPGATAVAAVGGEQSSQRSIWIVYSSGCDGGGGCRRRAVQPAEYLDRVPFRVCRWWLLLKGLQTLYHGVHDLEGAAAKAWGDAHYRETNGIYEEHGGA